MHRQPVKQEKFSSILKMQMHVSNKINLYKAFFWDSIWN